MSRRTAPVLAVLLALSLLLTGCGASKTTATGTGSSQSSSQPSEGASADSSGSAGSSGDCPTSNTKSFAKTKFVLHAGLAFGAFHRYLYKPYKNHAFSKGNYSAGLAGDGGHPGVAVVQHAQGGERRLALLAGG